MEDIKFEVNLISATDLERVVKKSNMKIYARVSIAGDPGTEQRTPADRHGDSNPAWNYNIKYNIGRFAVQQEGIMLVIRLYCKRTLLRDRYIGEVFTSLKGLYNHARAHGGGAMASFPLRKGSAVWAGMLNFSYRFEETAADDVFALQEGILQAGVVRILKGLLRSKFGIDMDGA